jgi:transposase
VSAEKVDIIERNTNNSQQLLTQEDKTMITIGVDFHKKTSSYHVLDENGTVLKRCKLANDPELFLKFISSFDGPKKLAMEATRSWDLYYDTIKDHVDSFCLGHPAKMKLITHQERKNDKQDAKHIAELTMKNYLPKAHVTETNERHLRSLVRARGSYVDKRRKIKQQIHALIDRNIWPCHKPKNFKNLFCARGITWLETVEVPKHERFILNHALNYFEYVSIQIKKIESYIAQCDVPFAQGKYLRSVPGFMHSIVNFYTVLVETSNINRFNKTKGYAYYAGLIPREHSSGEKYKTGGLVKGANMHLRTALIESTLAAIRVDKGLRAYYKKVKERKSSGPAIVATARKLANAIYYVLKEQRSYRYEHEIHAPAVACHSSSASFKK